MRISGTLLAAVCVLLALCALAGFTGGAKAAEVKVTADVPYKTGDALSPYDKERGKLDVYAPADAKNYPVLVWFYGGALTGGAKGAGFNANICRALASEGIVVVCPDYRLSPKVKYPAYIEDAAVAVAWTRQHAAEYGGDPSRVFVGGHSAGGYLTAMLGTDGHFLQAVGVDVQDLAGFIPVSGQMMTHYTVRTERGLPHDNLVADEAAPINHVHEKTRPWLILYTDHDEPMRGAEDQFFAAGLLQAGHHDVTCHEIPNRTHDTIAEWITHPGDPAREQIVNFIRRLSSAEPAK